ncbi:MAG: radical SAM protein [Candidatus Gorgyraea atricola]|nr:radical SAM protein [Candidatus Gorgyraea atricola]
MARIIFLQRIWYEYAGPEIISANLKRHGHNVDLFIGRHAKDFLKNIQEKDIVAFSVMSGEHNWAIETANQIKQSKDVLTVFGGPYPTFYPDVINHPGVDITCCGEGEFAMLDLANAYDEGNDYSNIPNISFKSPGGVKRNEVRPFIDDLDKLPFPDRGIYYDRYRIIRESPLKTFMASRGCPFSCSFCFNEKLRDIYRNKGKYIRFYSPGNLIDQIKETESRYGLKSIYFVDDLFVSDQKWLGEFLQRYKNEIKKPFVCSANVATLNERIIKLLKDAGCHAVSFGIETGNEGLRSGVLNKHITNGQIEDIGRLLKKYQLKAMTFNVIGFPGETVENTFETIDLNVKIGVEYPRCSFLTPYAGTRLAERYEGKIKMNDIGPAYQQTKISFEVPEPEKLHNLHCFFQTAVLFPRLRWLIKKTIILPPNIFFKVWWAVVYFFIFIKSETRGFFQTLVCAWRTFARASL